MSRKCRIPPKRISISIEPDAPFTLRWLAQAAILTQPYTDAKLAAKARNELTAQGFEVVLIDNIKHTVIG